MADPTPKQREERECVYRYRLKGDENDENMDWVYTENRGNLPHDAGGNGLSEWEIQTFVLDTSEHASDPEAEEREELTLAGDDIESLREYKRQASMLIEELEGDIDRLRTHSPEEPVGEVLAIDWMDEGGDPLILVRPFADDLQPGAKLYVHPIGQPLDGEGSDG